jgi:hypothetical protein
LASTIAGALIILAGILVLLDRLLGLEFRLFSWPLIVLGVGAAFFLGGFGSGASGLVIPGTIISGIAGILMWQNATGRWFSWAYVWTLIPGFVGLALFVFSLVSPREGANKDVRLASRWLMGISLALFLVFTTFLSPMRWFWAVLALALIGTGGYLIIRSRRSGQPAGKS